MRREKIVLRLRSQGSILLNNKDRDAFLAALGNPPEPNKELKRAYQEYKCLVKRKKSVKVNPFWISPDCLAGEVLESQFSL